MNRVLIFIDFWNLVLNWNKYHNQDKNIKIPFGDTLSKALLSMVENNPQYMGTNVYASSSTHDSKGFKGFLDILAMKEGYKVIVKHRKPSSLIHCNRCGKDVPECPHCKEALRKNVEKGVDTAIATELLRASFDNIFDKAILVSGDADFVPAVEYIQEKGKHVINASWKNTSFDLKKACWGHFHLEDLMGKLSPKKVTEN